MSEHATASEWSAGRGEKWHSHLGGMEATLAPVDEPLIEALQLTSPCRIADVGCGGGGTTIKILRRLPDGSAAHGFDISPALIAAAGQRVAAELPSRRDKISFVCADVAKEAPPSRPFDRLVSRFGTMFFDEPAAAFGNLGRWLAPGGRFAFATWGPPADNPWISYLRDAVAAVAEVPRPDFEAPGPFRYSRAEHLMSLLNQVGFVGLEVRRWSGVLPVGGGLPASEAARFALGSFALGELAAAAGEAAQAQAHRQLAARFSEHERDGAVYMGASVLIYTGSR